MHRSSIQSPHDHRRRRARRLRQGHAGGGPRAPLRAAASRYRPALPGGRPRGGGIRGCAGLRARARSRRRSALDTTSSTPKRCPAAEIGTLASKVAVIAGVRQALFEFQRDFATQPGGAVLDGRDIGTVIAPGRRRKAVHRRRQQGADGAPRPPVRGARARRLTATRSITRSRSGTRATAPTPMAASIPRPTRTCSIPRDLDIDAALRAAVAIVDGVMARKAEA